MIRLNQRIRIYNELDEIKLEFPFVTRVDINTDRSSFTDTAQIVLPQRTRRVNEKISDLINIGDKITVELGYFPNLETRFNGYVVQINPDSPMILNCEDEAFVWKKQSLTAKQYKDTTFRKLISDIYTGELRTTDDSIGTWTISENVTLIDVLDELRQKLGTLSYWQDGILYVNYEFEKDPEKTVIFDVQRNVPIGSDNLNVQKATDLNTISHGISPQNDGTKIELFATYKDIQGSDVIVSESKPLGVLNTLKIPNITKTALTELIKKRLPKLYYTGATGTIETFGEPTLKHGDWAAIRDRRIPDRNGKYKIVGLNIEHGIGIGYKQTAKIGLKVENFS